MKWFVYLLLLANISLFAWLRLEPTSAEQVMSAEVIPAGVTRLVLLDEVPQQMPQKKKPEPQRESVAEVAQVGAVDVGTGKPKVGESEDGDFHASKPEPVVVYQCHRLAGLESSSAADRLEGKFNTWGVEVLARGTEQIKQKSYWVMLPAFKSKKVAQSVIKGLKAAGFNDQYLIPSGTSKNVVSLGVFSTPEAAKRHRGRILALKLKGITSPKIEEIGLPSKRYWMSIRLRETEASIPWQKEVSQIKATTETITCL
ncbi:MAG: SPOR domain-containing protein [Gammaproteobacteria bacterium]|nr:SPOR domain-containing protein [Gammaproteobacteria bacterium]